MKWPKLRQPWLQKDQTSTSHPFTIDVFGVSARGLVRRQNQDDFYVSEAPPFFMVADGLGGLQEGAVASYLAVQRATETLTLAWDKNRWAWHPYMGPRPDNNPMGIPELIVGQAFDRAHFGLLAVTSRSQMITDMATTLCLALLADRRLVYGNLGDSRAYLLRDRKLRCLTVDDTEAMPLLQSGKISKQAYENHPFRNTLTKRLGGPESHLPSVEALELQSGDMILLCTDGLYGMVQEERIRIVLLNEEHDAKWKANQLLMLAEHAGGEDNITVVVAHLA